MYQWDKIKVIGNYDTVVVGGGTAGAAAGIRAAKEGNRVLIVEKSLALGGAAVNALVNPMMESFVEHGEIFHEIERRLKEKGVTTRDGIMEYVQSTAEAKALVLEEMFLEYGGEILYDAVLTDCQVKDQKIEKIFVTTEEGVYAIEAEQFVDATGDAVLSRMAGVAYTAGDENDWSKSEPPKIPYSMWIFPRAASSPTKEPPSEQPYAAQICPPNSFFIYCSIFSVSSVIVGNSVCSVSSNPS